MINQGVDAMVDKDFSVKLQEIGQGEVDGLISVYNRMMDQLRVERTQKIQKHFFLEKLITNSPSGIIILDLEGKVSSINPQALKFLNMKAEEVIGKNPATYKNTLLKMLLDFAPGETQIVSANGMETFKCQKAQFIDRGFSNFFIIIQELTSEKLEIEKLAYGKVIRMMAHEVNNSIGPINSILESLDFYKHHIPEEDRKDYRDILKIAHQRNEKLNDFMHNFAKVVRLPDPMLEKIDLRTLAERMVNFMSYQLGEKDIDLKLDLPAEPVWVSLDVKQMEQVLINVLKNSIEAIASEGSITVQVSRKKPNLKIIDTGSGMNEDLQVFSPFFSTKKNGQGIGLTLSREILLKHGFDFSLKPGDKGGAVFQVSLPLFRK